MGQDDQPDSTDPSNVGLQDRDTSTLSYLPWTEATGDEMPLA